MPDEHRPRHFDARGREVDRLAAQLRPSTGPYRDQLDDPSEVRRQLAARRPGPGEPEIGYRYSKVYRRRRRLNRWLHQRGQSVIAVTALAIVAAYALITVQITAWWFPSTAAAWSLGAVGLALVGLLLAVVMWARRD